MRLILITLVAVSAFAAKIAAAAPSADQLIQAFRIADSDCRGSSDPGSVETRMECDRRSRISGRLAQLGWCYGMKGQVGGDFKWHRCSPRSITTDDLQASGQP